MTFSRRTSPVRVCSSLGCVASGSIRHVWPLKSLIWIKLPVRRLVGQPASPAYAIQNLCPHDAGQPKIRDWVPLSRR